VTYKLLNLALNNNTVKLSRKNGILSVENKNGIQAGPKQRESDLWGRDKTTGGNNPNTDTLNFDLKSCQQRLSYEDKTVKRNLYGRYM